LVFAGRELLEPLLLAGRLRRDHFEAGRASMLSLFWVLVCVVLQPTINSAAHPAAILHRHIDVVGFIILA